MMNSNFVLFLVLQIVIWFIMPLNGSSATHANHAISLIIMLQYVPRLLVIFPLNSKIIRNTGVVAKTAWSGAAYNLLLYLLAGHVSSAVFDSIFFFFFIKIVHKAPPFLNSDPKFS